MKKNYTKALLLFSILITILIIGCKRESVLDNPIGPILPPPTTVTIVNDLTQVTASVSGIVLDESNAPISSAVVTSGGATTTTNSNGMFIFQNISLSKENGSVTVVKAGYFKGIRSFKTTTGKNHTVRLQLMQKVLSGTVNATAGGTINSNGGASIIFPAAAFVTGTGAAYTGTVNVYSRWINPTAANLPFIIPGDLRGVGTNGAENILETYGMVGAELEDANGNTLKIATGKKATISFPLPASLQASAPATIQLWHFDDATARWKENGSATKAGSTYTAQVDKFSFWNCDVANSNFINLDYTLINASTNSSLISTSTRVKRVSNGSYAYGITNNAGFVSGLVPKNEALVLEVVSGCGAVIYSQNVGPFSTNTSLGNINVTLIASQVINFSGTLINCNATPVSNGYVSLYATSGIGAYATTSTIGAFSFSILNCTGVSLPYSCIGVDNSTSLRSSILIGSSISGNINLGIISACGVTSGGDVYVVGMEENAAHIGMAKLWKNGVGTNLSSGANGSAGRANSVFVTDSDVYVVGYQNINQQATIWKNGNASYLTSTSGVSGANSIYVVGIDIYVAGFDGAKARIWKNGIATDLTNGSTTAMANSVFVSGTDVYVAGWEKLSSGNKIAKLWKNGSVINLNTGIGNSAEAKSVIVSGTDVYVAGQEGLAKVWKNGIGSNLQIPTGSSINVSSVNSMYISGNDVYVVGEYFSSPMLWKNGLITNNLFTTGTIYTNTTGVFVKGSDIYVIGYDQTAAPSGFPGDIAKVWKNGFPINLSSGNEISQPWAVYVK